MLRSRNTKHHSTMEDAAEAYSQYEPESIDMPIEGVRITGGSSFMSFSSAMKDFLEEQESEIDIGLMLQQDPEIVIVDGEKSIENSSGFDMDEEDIDVSDYVVGEENFDIESYVEIR